MALSLGVAAMFFGVVFIIAGWKGGGSQTMESNLAGMIKGYYPVSGDSGHTSKSTAKSGPTTSTSGGANSSGSK